MAAKEEDGNEGMLGGLREMVQLLQQMLSQDPDQGGENKRNSDETSSDEQGTSIHQLAGLSTTYEVLLAYKKSDQVGESDLASKYNLPDDEEVTNPIDYTSSDYAAIGDQLEEHFSHLSIEKDGSKELAYDASLKQDSSSSDHLEAEQAQYGGTHEHASDFTSDVTQLVNPAQAPPRPKLQRQNAMPRERHTREQDPGYAASSLKQYMSKILSSSSDHLEAEQAQYGGAHEHASDFTFDVTQAPPKPRLQRQNAMQRQRNTREQPVNPEQPPPKPRLQRQNAMRRQRHTSELDPGYSASYLNQPMPTIQSITTASSLGYSRPLISMNKALTTATDFVPQRNQQAMNPHYSQWQQYGDITSSLYSPPNQNEGYNNVNMPALFHQQGGSNMAAHNGSITNSPYLPPSAAAASQQLGGSTNNTSAHYGNIMTSAYWQPDQNDSYNYNMPPQSAASVDPYAYGSLNLFGTSSDNGYESGVSRNHLPPVQQHDQSGDSNLWRPSSRRSQRQQQLRSDFLAALNQQRLCQRDN